MSDPYTKDIIIWGTHSPGELELISKIIKTRVSECSGAISKFFGGHEIASFLAMTNQLFFEMGCM